MLRTRIYLGLVPLLLLIVGTGVYALFVCHDMAGAYQRDLLASYDASLAAHRMRTAAARMDDALAGFGRGGALRAQRTLQDARDAFNRELLELSAKAAGTRRAPDVVAIDRAFQDYSQRREAPADGDSPGSLGALDENEAAFNRVLAAIDALVDHDYAAAREAGKRARSLERTTLGVLGGVVAGGSLVALLLAWRLAAFMEAILRSNPDPLFMVGRDGRAHLRNPAAEALATGPAFAEGFPPEIAARVREVLDRTRDFLPAGYDHLVPIRSGTEERFYQPRIRAIRDPSGLSGAAVLLQDVTRFRLLDDAKNNLVGTVSHELKTPLTGLRLAVYLLLEKNLGPLTPGQAELLEIARDDADRLLRILNDLLDLARLESGVTRLERTDVEVDGLLAAVAREFAPIAAGRGQTVMVRCAPGLGSVPVDPERIRHVFINLLANASAYSPEGGPIELYARAGDAGFVRCGVLDRGPGVPPESATLIFEKFYRLPGQEGKGAGLGLSICREIVLAHGGSIACSRRPEGGSDFHFLLPGNTSRPADTKVVPP